MHGGEGRAQRGTAVFYNLILGGTHFMTAAFCWPHRPALYRVGGAARGSEHKRQDLWRPMRGGITEMPARGRAV